VFGDGVNVAARLEALAEPGGICVSHTVREHVRDRVEYGFDDLGEQHVKNIARPLRVFRLVFDPDAAPAQPPSPRDAFRGPGPITRRRRHVYPAGWRAGQFTFGGVACARASYGEIRHQACLEPPTLSSAMTCSMLEHAVFRTEA